jgi:hypothetical protein
MADDTKNTIVTDEPVKWNARQNKITFGSVLDLTVDPLLNVRFRAGSEVFGVKLERDTYDLPGMKQQIVDGNGVREPVTVSVRKDGSKVVIRGNRRTLAGTELVNDPSCPAELKKQLTEHFPMLLLHGLTPEQEREMINDQTQKQFLRSEVIRYIFSLRKQNWTFDRIALLLWETLGRFSGNAKKVAEIREINDPTLKREKIRLWLRGTLDNYILWGYDLGPIVQKAILLSEMQVDGVLPETSEKPYFIATKNSQKRIAALKKAKEADGSKWNGMILVEGSEFKKVMDGFRAEDYGTVSKPPTPKGPQMLKRTELEGMKDSFQSNAVRSMIRRVLGEDAADLQIRDEFAAVCETKELLATQYLPRLKPEIAAIVRFCFVNPDPTDFQNFLESNCVAEEPKPAEMPAAAESETFELGGESQE